MVNTTFTPSHTFPLLPPPNNLILEPLAPLFSHPLLNDANLTIVAPIVAYWALSLTFEVIDYYDIFARYRLHTPEEVLRRNRVTKKEVLIAVFLQQVFQMGFAYFLTILDGPEMTGHENWEVYKWYLRVVGFEGWTMRGLMVLGIDGTGLEQKIGQGIIGLGALVKGMDTTGFASDMLSQGSATDWRMSVASGLYWYIIPAIRFWIALFLVDTWQYFLHRLMHSVPTLYRAIHSQHHRLYCPYAFGALYNHPIEGFLMDTIGAGMSFMISGMTQRGGMFFFVFSTLKTVDDHCGYKLPWDPLQWLFWNNAEYHDIHHQSWGIKTNFSQPFFICWDRWLDTQWVGGDATAKRKAKALKIARGEKSSGEESDPQNITGTISRSTNTNIATTTATNTTANGTILHLNAISGEKSEKAAAMLVGNSRIGGGISGTKDEDSGWDSNSSHSGADEMRTTRRRRMAAAR